MNNLCVSDWSKRYIFPPFGRCCPSQGQPRTTLEVQKDQTHLCHTRLEGHVGLWLFVFPGAVVVPSGDVDSSQVQVSAAGAEAAVALKVCHLSFEAGGCL